MKFYLVVGRGAGLVCGVLLLASLAHGDAVTLPVSRVERLQALKLLPGTLGIDLDFFLKPEALPPEVVAVPGSAQMIEVVRVGSRAVRWADILQKNLPIESREQLWRRVDHLGTEPTPAHPIRYNPTLIQAAFSKAVQEADPDARAIFTGMGELPAAVPLGLKLTDVIGAIREISLAYSRASRWLMLYEWHDELDQGSRDLRPWLALKDGFTQLQGALQNWARLSRLQRLAWITEVAQSCPISGLSQSQCVNAHFGLADQASGAAAAKWLDEVLKKGQPAYDAHFGVTVPHPGAKVQRMGDHLEVLFGAVGVSPGPLDWIRSRVAAGWVFPGSISAVLQEALDNFEGAVHVVWKDGALPHVNAVGGDTITMDSNLAQWLEQAQVTMTHEFGHVIGFPDCYAEFWAPSELNGGAFIEYALDVEDRMCALSGSTLDRHRVALLNGFKE